MRIQQNQEEERVLQSHEGDAAVNMKKPSGGSRYSILGRYQHIHLHGYGVAQYVPGRAKKIVSEHAFRALCHAGMRRYADVYMDICGNI